MKTNVTPCYKVGFVIDFIISMLAASRVFFRSRSDTALEILALRQQVAVLKRKRRRPRLKQIDRLVWTSLRRLWSRWSEVLLIVKPATVSMGAGDPGHSAVGQGSPYRFVF